MIRALNDDKPWDEFIREQLAGDEMVGYPREPLSAADTEKLIATGFLRMAPDGTASADVDQNVSRNLVVAETLKIVSTSLLGLTVGCAECHDHKYDPIPQSDYYRLRAVFEPALDWKKWRVSRKRLVSLSTSAERKESAALEAEAAKIDARRKELEQQFVEQTFEEELAKLPEDLHASLREAFKVDVKKRSLAQKRLLQANPSINVSGGSLYLYDRPRKAALKVAETKLAELRKKTADDSEDEAHDEIAALESEIEKIRQSIASDQLDALTKEAVDIRARKPVEEFVHALTEIPGDLPKTFVFHRGDYSQPRQPVEPGEPRVLASSDDASTIATKNGGLATSGRRLAWAERLTDGTHPLVARVLVNRVWMHHFGRGLVATPSDFGVLGETPSHPELLDWLANDFMNNGWRLKRFHRLIMTSSVYRQASPHRADQEGIDPDNRLLARMNVRRFEAEAIRDTILAVSGKLNPKPFGRPIPVTVDEVGQVVLGIDTRDSAGRPTGKNVSLGDELFRRSIYIQVRRSMPLGMLETFDAPTMTTNCNCESRATSTVAPQSLIMMNSQFLLDQAAEFAARLDRDAPGDLQQQVRLAWQLAFARLPSQDEIRMAVEFVEQQTPTFDAKDKVPPRSRALASLCQALLSSNEFLYVD